MFKKTVLGLSLVSSLFAVPPAPSVVSPAPAVYNGPSNVVDAPSYTAPTSNGFNNDIINNDPNLKLSPIITLEAVGEGVAPLNTISPAQAHALARRAAIADAYRAMSEKLYGVRVTAKDKVKNLVAVNSEIRTLVYGVVKGAQIEDKDFKDGLYRVHMEVKINMCDWQSKINCRNNQCIYRCN